MTNAAASFVIAGGVICKPVINVCVPVPDSVIVPQAILWAS